jgi:hypothetical protein
VGFGWYEARPPILMEQGYVTACELARVDACTAELYARFGVDVDAAARGLAAAHRALLRALAAEHRAVVRRQRASEDATTAARSALAWLARSREATRRALDDDVEGASGLAAAPPRRQLTRPRLTGLRDHLRLVLVALEPHAPVLAAMPGWERLLDEGEAVLRTCDVAHVGRGEAVRRLVTARADRRAAVARVVTALQRLDAAARAIVMATGAPPEGSARTVLTHEAHRQRALAMLRKRREAGAATVT